MICGLSHCDINVTNITTTIPSNHLSVVVQLLLGLEFIFINLFDHLRKLVVGDGQGLTPTFAYESVHFQSVEVYISFGLAGSTGLLQCLNELKHAIELVVFLFKVKVHHLRDKYRPLLEQLH